MPDSIREFVEPLRGWHEAIRRNEYFSFEGRTGRQITALTRFVFEFFIYNSLYQVDWERSGPCAIQRHSSEMPESRQQEIFEDHLREIGTQHQLEVRNIFTMMIRRNRLQDRSEDEGGRIYRRFARSLEAIQTMLEKPDATLDVPAFFEEIRRCRKVVYEVRCNLFHGRKTMAMALEPDQERRLRAYWEFLSCLIGFFFTSCREGGHELPLSPDRMPLDQRELLGNG